MRTNLGRALLAAGLATLALVAAVSTPATADPAHAPGPTPDGRVAFLGDDGHRHAPAPLLVRGRHGVTFYGGELDSVCKYGADITAGLRRISALARVIEQSGRRVVWTVGPNKSAVDGRDLPRTARLPHRRCDARGIAAQDHALDSFTDRAYLPLRRALAVRADAGDQMYWPVDTHWTSLSTARFATALATRLDPRIGRLQRFRPATETIQTDLSSLGLIPPSFETGPARVSTTPVHVTLAPAAGPAGAFVTAPQSWTTRPAARAWRGRTLLVGDSFLQRALPNLRPVLHRGTFLWVDGGTGKDAVPALVDAIVHSRTVVLETVQRWVPIGLLGSPALRKALQAALSRS